MIGCTNAGIVASETCTEASKIGSCATTSCLCEPLVKASKMKAHQKELRKVKDHGTNIMRVRLFTSILSSLAISHDYGKNYKYEPARAILGSWYDDTFSYKFQIPMTLH